MAVGVNLAAQGLLALGLAPIFQLAQLEKERCLEFIGRGIEVTEALDTSIPTNEGEVQTFEATIWRLWDEGERSSQRDAKAEGTLAITERSILFVPPPGTAGVRIPYELVLTVELSPINPYSMTVRSCTGRFETFYFWRREPNTIDPESAAAAIAQLTTRVAAFRASTHKATDTPH